VILCLLVRKMLSWRALELKQKAFLEAGNNSEFITSMKKRHVKQKGLFSHFSVW
jgi:hypothetical protein